MLINNQTPYSPPRSRRTSRESPLSLASKELARWARWAAVPSLDVRDPLILADHQHRCEVWPSRSPKESLIETIGPQHSLARAGAVCRTGSSRQSASSIDALVLLRGYNRDHTSNAMGASHCVCFISLASDTAFG